ncbi:MAG: hypothetical protein ACP5PZ_04015 [Bacteroidales bacterium]
MNQKSTRFLKVGDAHFGKIETKVYFTEALNSTYDADKDSWLLNGGIANPWVYKIFLGKNRQIWEK